MSVLKKVLQRFRRDESGQGLVEYILIIALVSVGVMLVMVVFRNEMGKRMDDVSNTLQTARTTPYPAAGS
jgi:Flp pilus assembly pilin Flp